MLEIAVVEDEVRAADADEELELELTDEELDCVVGGLVRPWLEVSGRLSASPPPA